jgi:hypothetical protein
MGRKRTTDILIRLIPAVIGLSALVIGITALVRD